MSYTGDCRNRRGPDIDPRPRAASEGAQIEAARPKGIRAAPPYPACTAPRSAPNPCDRNGKHRAKTLERGRYGARTLPLTVDRARRIHVSRQLCDSRSRATRDYFQPFEKATLRPAARFDPEPAFLQ